MPRRRKPGKRTKSGRLSRSYSSAPVRDNGTPQAQAKRIAIVGTEADPALAASALGIVFAAGYLDREQYDEALAYGSLHAAIYGTPWANTSGATDMSDDRMRILKQHLNKREAAMSVPQREAVLHLVSLNYLPAWFVQLRLGHPCGQHDDHRRHLLIGGLNAMLGRNNI